MDKKREGGIKFKYQIQKYWELIVIERKIERMEWISCLFFFQIQEDRFLHVFSMKLSLNDVNVFAINYPWKNDTLTRSKIFFLSRLSVISSSKFHGIKLLLSVRGNCPLWNWTLWCCKVLNETRNIGTTRRKKFL